MVKGQKGQNPLGGPLHEDFVERIDEAGSEVQAFFTVLVPIPFRYLRKILSRIFKIGSTPPLLPTGNSQADRHVT